MTTTVTSFAGRIEPVDKMDNFADRCGDGLKDLKKRTNGQVADLTAPQPLHPAQVEGFKDILAQRTSDTKRRGLAPPRLH